MSLRVCIVGGGHIGTTLACYIKHSHPNYKVNLYTQHPDMFSNKIICNDIENKNSYSVTLDAISNSPDITVKGTEIIFVALPHFAIEQTFANIQNYVDDNAYVGILPGGGGCEFFFHKYFKKSVSLFGFQRVPFTAKLVEYGNQTNLKSWKPYNVVGTLYKDRLDECCSLIEECGLKTKKASNYLEIALTPTNPILHTSRMYELLRGYNRDHIFEEKKKFYVGWADFASKILFAMDAELHSLLESMDGIETSAIKPLSEHYESPTVSEMTHKINNIETFKTVYLPMLKVERGYVVDTSSRMFTEDFPWGLVVIRSYFDYFEINSPTIDEVLKWCAGYLGCEWYNNLGEFNGQDLKLTGAIRKYGVSNKNELLDFYKR